MLQSIFVAADFLILSHLTISAEGASKHVVNRTFVLSTMGSFGDKSLQCDWCDWWGMLMATGATGVLGDLPDHMALIEVEGPTLTLLCLRCAELKEPPWYPNNRQRCADWLLKISRGLPNHQRAVVEVSGTIAPFLAANTK